LILLSRDPGVLAYHFWELRVSANEFQLRRKLEAWAPCCEKPNKGVLCYRVTILRLMIHSREPAVLAYHPGELTISANILKLRRPPGAEAQKL
jgi:hypothetical protein